MATPDSPFVYLCPAIRRAPHPSPTPSTTQDQPEGRSTHSVVDPAAPKAETGMASEVLTAGDGSSRSERGGGGANSSVADADEPGQGGGGEVGGVGGG